MNCENCEARKATITIEYAVGRSMYICSTCLELFQRLVNPLDSLD
jgi:protein-arginine kinase activator protein McsA